MLDISGGDNLDSGLFRWAGDLAANLPRGRLGADQLDTRADQRPWVSQLAGLPNQPGGRLPFHGQRSADEAVDCKLSCVCWSCVWWTGTLFHSCLTPVTVVFFFFFTRLSFLFMSDTRYSHVLYKSLISLHVSHPMFCTSLSFLFVSHPLQWCLYHVFNFSSCLTLVTVMFCTTRQ